MELEIDPEIPSPYDSGRDNSQDEGSNRSGSRQIRAEDDEEIEEDHFRRNRYHSREEVKTENTPKQERMAPMNKKRHHPSSTAPPPPGTNYPGPGNKMNTAGMGGIKPMKNIPQQPAGGAMKKPSAPPPYIQQFPMPPSYPQMPPMMFNPMNPYMYQNPQMYPPAAYMPQPHWDMSHFPPPHASIPEYTKPPEDYSSLPNQEEKRKPPGPKMDSKFNPNNQNNNSNEKPKIHEKKHTRPPQQQHSNQSDNNKQDRDGLEPHHKVYVSDKGPQRMKNDNNQQHTPQQQKRIQKNTIVYVKNIQDHHNTVEGLTKYFKRFGSIINIKVEQPAKMATIEFKTPQNASNAIKSKKVLFGDKGILLTADPNASVPTSPKHGENAKAQHHSDTKVDVQDTEKLKLNEKLTEKLKFLIEIKRYLSNEESKKELLKLITEIKEAQKTGILTDKLNNLLSYENLDLNFEFAQALDSIPQNYWDNKASLRTYLESYGKLDYFKPNPKDKKAELKYASPDSAIKALNSIKDFNLKFSDQNALDKYQKIKEFQDTILSP
jgi:hypothetical protein